MSSVDFLADLGPSADVRALARVLSAAAAPPRPHELRGYEAARRAFENAGTGGAAAIAGTTPVRRGVGVPLRRLIGVKLVAVAGALTVTGVAVAAEADVLPSPIQRAAHQVLGGVGVPDADHDPRSGQNMAPSSESSSGPSGSKVSQSPNRASGDPSGSGGLLPGTPVSTSGGLAPSTAAPAADVVALCRTYVAHQGDSDGNGNGDGSGGLSEHDRRKLATLAGGADKIADFCAQVLAAPSQNPIPQPTGVPTTPAGSTAGTPSPSHDHKPDPSTSSSDGALAPASSQNGNGNGNGHGHTPTPSRNKH